MNFIYNLFCPVSNNNRCISMPDARLGLVSQVISPACGDILKPA